MKQDDLCTHQVAPLLCEKVDAYYCPACGQWTEEQCDDVDCDYCRARTVVHDPDCSASHHR